jgi:hypothetical protein
MFFRVLVRLRLLLPAIVIPILFTIAGLYISNRGLDFPGAAWLLLSLWTMGLASLGIFLYMMRREARLLYGLIETAAGLGGIVAALLNAIRLLSGPPEANRFVGQNRFVALFSLAAAIYVVVRGLDNIGEGLHDGSKAHSWWNSIFPKSGS